MSVEIETTQHKARCCNELISCCLHARGQTEFLTVCFKDLLLYALKMIMLKMTSYECVDH